MSGVEGTRYSIHPHSLWPQLCSVSQAVSNALEHNADVVKVRDWLGHADISTTQVYDKRGSRPEDSPTFKVWY